MGLDGVDRRDGEIADINYGLYESHFPSVLALKAVGVADVRTAKGQTGIGGVPKGWRPWGLIFGPAANSGCFLSLVPQRLSNEALPMSLRGQLVSRTGSERFRSRSGRHGWCQKGATIPEQIDQGPTLDPRWIEEVTSTNFFDRPVVFAEGEEDEQWLARRAVRLAEFKNPVVFQHNGRELLEYLQRPDAPGREHLMPALILLDLNLPEISGLEVLEEMHRDPAFRMIPTVVLSTSRDPADIAASYRLGASSFISKSTSFDDFLNAMKLVREYWLDVVRLPLADTATITASRTG